MVHNISFMNSTRNKTLEETYLGSSIRTKWQFIPVYKIIILSDHSMYYLFLLGNYVSTYLKLNNYSYHAEIKSQQPPSLLPNCN